MKHYLLALCLLLATAASAQKKQPVLLPTSPVAYCLLVVSGRYFITDAHLQLDYGQNMQQPVQNTELAALAEQVWHFTSVPAGLNYLYSQGWECVQNATLTTETSGHYVESQIGYLLRRRTL